VVVFPKCSFTLSRCRGEKVQSEKMENGEKSEKGILDDENYGNRVEVEVIRRIRRYEER
jgi:hypothetical protein